MATKTETGHTAGFIVSEANGNRSRETVTIKSGQDLKAGQVIGTSDVAGGNYAAFDNTGTTGVPTAEGILIEDCDASAAAKDAAMLARDAEVNESECTLGHSSATTDLASIIFR